MDVMGGKQPTDAKTKLDIKSNSTLSFFSSNALPRIQSSTDFSFYSESFANTEEMALIFLFDANQQPIGHVWSTSKSKNMIDFSIRELVQIALETGSWSILVAHNHPSESATPSHADIAHTRNILKAMHPLKIVLRDHIIFTATSQFSFKSHGLI